MGNKWRVNLFARDFCIQAINNWGIEMFKKALIAFGLAFCVSAGVSSSAFAGIDGSGSAMFEDILGTKNVYENVGTGRSGPTSARSRINYSSKYGAGSVIVDTQAKYLYLVEPGGTAIRYGIGTARPGFEWGGNLRISRKTEWPGWTPPPAMRRREPWLPAHMPGGPENPLGARALYLGSSLYRIHGTNQGTTIGRSVSSGCIRMHNKDVMDLYERVSVGAKVVVIR